MRCITCYIDLKEGMTIGDFLKEVRKEIALSLSYSCYPHTNMLPEPNMSFCVIYQKEYADGGDTDTLLGQKLVELPKHSDSNESLIDMEIYEAEEGTEIVLTYIPSCYTDESMNRFRRMIMKSAALLVRYAEEPEYELDRLLSIIKDDNPGSSIS